MFGLIGTRFSGISFPQPQHTMIVRTVLQSREINEPGGGVLVRLVRIIARFWVVRVFARSELLSLVDPDKGATRCSGGPRHRYLIYSIQPTGVPERP